MREDTKLNLVWFRQLPNWATDNKIITCLKSFQRAPRSQQDSNI